MCREPGSDSSLSICLFRTFVWIGADASRDPMFVIAEYATAIAIWENGRQRELSCYVKGNVSLLLGVSCSRGRGYWLIDTTAGEVNHRIVALSAVATSRWRTEVTTMSSKFYFWSSWIDIWGVMAISKSSLLSMWKVVHRENVENFWWSDLTREGNLILWVNIQSIVCLKITGRTDGKSMASNIQQIMKSDWVSWCHSDIWRMVVLADYYYFLKYFTIISILLMMIRMPMILPKFILWESIPRSSADWVTSRNITGGPIS
jgi:hypothetical protein